MSRIVTDPALDPTTEAIVASNDERDRLRVEVLNLSKALVAAYTDVEVVTAERGYLVSEIDRLKTIGDAMFVEGCDQAVREIRDHFKKLQQAEVVAEIEKTWLKGQAS